jgi:hypothetical protein
MLLFFGWPSSLDDCCEWLDLLEETYHPLWKDDGLYDMIIISKHEIVCELQLVHGLLGYRSTAINRFTYLFGMLSPTSMDKINILSLLERVPSDMAPHVVTFTQNLSSLMPRKMFSWEICFHDYLYVDNIFESLKIFVYIVCKKIKIHGGDGSSALPMDEIDKTNY